MLAVNWIYFLNFRDGDDPSRDDRSRGDEEDSAATSISDDAMIDDEIADQPGLLMLGQSASVPSSPSRSWRLNLYDCHVPAMSLASCHSLQSEEELDELSDSTRLGYEPCVVISYFKEQMRAPPNRNRPKMSATFFCTFFLLLLFLHWNGTGTA